MGVRRAIYSAGSNNGVSLITSTCTTGGGKLGDRKVIGRSGNHHGIRKTKGDRVKCQNNNHYCSCRRSRNPGVLFDKEAGKKMNPKPPIVLTKKGSGYEKAGVGTGTGTGTGLSQVKNPITKPKPTALQLLPRSPQEDLRQGFLAGVRAARQLTCLVVKTNRNISRFTEDMENVILGRSK